LEINGAAQKENGKIEKELARERKEFEKEQSRREGKREIEEGIIQEKQGKMIGDVTIVKAGEVRQRKGEKQIKKNT